MSRTNLSLSKQLIVASALAFGVSSVALADDSSMNASTGNAPGGQTRTNMDMLAQTPCPQRADSAGARQGKDEQKMESKTLSVNRRTPVIYPYVQPYFQQYPGQ
jgi:hypothetical protein